MRNEDPLPPAETFRLPAEGPDDPRPIIRRMVEEMDEFAHLRHGEAVIMTVFRAEPKSKNGKLILGYMAMPRFQGSLADFGLWLLATSCGGTLPDFLMVLDAEFWSTATPHQRDALIHHELMHAGHQKGRDGEPRFTDEGLPVWGLEPHSLEEFNTTVRRFGAWQGDISAFIVAAREGGAVL
jgi:hypothetical protein